MVRPVSSLSLSSASGEALCGAGFLRHHSVVWLCVREAGVSHESLSFDVCGSGWLLAAPLGTALGVLSAYLLFE